MIDLYVDIRGFAHELAELLRAFMPDKKVNILETQNSLTVSDLRVDVNIFKDNQEVYVCSRLLKAGELVDEASESLVLSNLICNELLERRYIKNAAKRCVYDMISQFIDKELEWGILTGIRPTKIVNEILDDGRSTAYVFECLNSEYMVSASKANLLIDTVSQQRDILSKNSSRKISLYINIPFCTTKCLYCSFPSDTITRCAEELDVYIDTLIYEISYIMDIVLARGYSVQTVYIGGGTPTSLQAYHLERLLKVLEELIPSSVEEYTVEGGRPDSLDVEKLHILKTHGVNRISINPQTMNDHTLRKIGRAHTPYDIVKCFNAARQVGFDFINMDVIIGLPGEDLLDIEKTMKEIYCLSPENLTIHTLAVKKGSPLRDKLSDYEFADELVAEEMLYECVRWAKRMDMVPYYLYRQKYMLGNLENIGYAKPKKRCIYNIQMMEERQTILAFGAGGVSKIFYEPENRIERVANVKDHTQYIDRIDEMIARKTNIILK